MKILAVRIPDKLRAALERQAEAADRRLSDYVRHILRIMADNDITPQELIALREEEQ